MPTSKISISSLLDVPDIIKFQVELLKFAGYPNLIKCYVPDAHQMILAAASRAGLHIGMFDWYFPPRAERRNIHSMHFESVRATVYGLKRLLLPRRASWIVRQMREARAQANPLTAFLPHPSFMVEEQRTQFKPGSESGRNGKTLNSDPRGIKPIYIRGCDPLDNLAQKDLPFSYQEFISELDKDRLASEAEFVKNRQLMDRLNFPNAKAYLHEHIPKVWCYAFRGDKRSPAEVSRDNGFRPGVTRNDPFLAEEYKRQGRTIDAALKLALDVKDGGKLYREIMKRLDVLTLGVYTAQADFKGFISTSTSVVIAKHFANAYADRQHLFDPVYCYAVRCKGAFHLPTEAIRANDDLRKWSKMIDATNSLVHNAEQEVAMPGGISWADVVGMRKMNINAKGQFFTGPVFLSNTLRQEYQVKNPKTIQVKGRGTVNIHRLPPDDDAFDDLFELFSGKSQGQSHEICWSYDEPPFDCPPELMRERNHIEKFRQMAT